MRSIIFIFIVVFFNQVAAQKIDLAPPSKGRIYNIEGKKLSVNCLILKLKGLPIEFTYDTMTNRYFLSTGNILPSKFYNLNNKYEVVNYYKKSRPKSYASYGNHRYILTNEKTNEGLIFKNNNENLEPIKISGIPYIIDNKNQLIISKSGKDKIKTIDANDYKSIASLNYNDTKNITKLEYNHDREKLYIIDNGLKIVDIKTNEIFNLAAKTDAKNTKKIATDILITAAAITAASLIAVNVVKNPSPIRYQPSNYFYSIQYNPTQQSSSTSKGHYKLLGFHSNVLEIGDYLYWMGADRSFKYDLLNKKIVYQNYLVYSQNGNSKIWLENGQLHQLNYGYVYTSEGLQSHAIPAYNIFDTITGFPINLTKLAMDKSDHLLDYQKLSDTTILAVFNNRIDLVNLKNKTINNIKKNERISGIIESDFFYAIKSLDNESVLDRYSINKDSIYILGKESIISCSNDLSKRFTVKYDNVFYILHETDDYVVVHNKNKIYYNKNKVFVLTKDGRILFEDEFTKYFGLQNGLISYSRGKKMYLVDPKDILTKNGIEMK